MFVMGLYLKYGGSDFYNKHMKRGILGFLLFFTVQGVCAVSDEALLDHAQAILRKVLTPVLHHLSDEHFVELTSEEVVQIQKLLVDIYRVTKRIEELKTFKKQFDFDLKDTPKHLTKKVEGEFVTELAHLQQVLPALETLVSNLEPDGLSLMEQEEGILNGIKAHDLPAHDQELGSLAESFVRGWNKIKELDQKNVLSVEEEGERQIQAKQLRIVFYKAFLGVLVLKMKEYRTQAKHTSKKVFRVTLPIFLSTVLTFIISPYGMKIAPEIFSGVGGISAITSLVTFAILLVNITEDRTLNSLKSFTASREFFFPFMEKLARLSPDFLSEGSVFDLMERLLKKKFLKDPCTRLLMGTATG